MCSRMSHFTHCSYYDNIYSKTKLWTHLDHVCPCTQLQCWKVITSLSYPLHYTWYANVVVLDHSIRLRWRLPCDNVTNFINWSWWYSRGNCSVENRREKKKKRRSVMIWASFPTLQSKNFTHKFTSYKQYGQWRQWVSVVIACKFCTSGWEPQGLLIFTAPIATFSLLVFEHVLSCNSPSYKTHLPPEWWYLHWQFSHWHQCPVQTLHSHYSQTPYTVWVVWDLWSHPQSCWLYHIWSQALRRLLSGRRAGTPGHLSLHCSLEGPSWVVRLCWSLGALVSCGEQREALCV